MKNIYKVEIADYSYDCYDSFIIYAETPKEARKIASNSAADEGDEVWLIKSKVTLLKPRKTAGVILGSFNAG